MEDDDLPQLSAETFTALQEFYREQSERECKLQKYVNTNDTLPFEEDWQLSQFWYDDHTVNILVAAVTNFQLHAKVALVSCPSLYTKMKEAGHEVTLFEYDQRFSIYGDDYTFYDYKSPLDIPRNLASHYDIVLADPPFLSDECLTKTAVTVKFLTKQNIVLCTGEIMAELSERLLAVKKCKFIPTHTRNLANEFCCFANFDLDLFIDSTQKR